MDLSRIRALTFDVGGTVFNWYDTLRDEVAGLAARRSVRVGARRFANEWRQGMFGILQRVRAASSLNERRRDAPDWRWTKWRPAAKACHSPRPTRRPQPSVAPALGVA
jgi:FMN phosphatase YigB (HAD superfamily)